MLEESVVESPISKLIAASLEREQQTQAEAEARAQQKIEDARQAIISACGAFWSSFAPYATFRTDQRYYTMVADIDGEALGLAPFFIGVSTQSVSAKAVRPDGIYCDQIGQHWIFADFLRERAAALPIIKAQQKAAAIKALVEVLQPSYHRHDPASETDAIAAFDELNRIDPQNGAANEQAFDDWRKQRTAFDKKQARAAWLAEAQRVAALDYEPIFAAYVEEFEAVLKRNLERIARCQEELDQPFQVWKLTYGVVADDEEGGPEVETREVYALHPEPVDGHYWEVYKGQTFGGCTLRRRFYNPVSLDDFIWTRPTQKLVARYVSVSTCNKGMGIYVHPGLADEIVLRRLALEPDPLEPVRPAILDDYETALVEQLVYRARAGQTEESTDEIPF